jgi:hypothetical protein
MHCPAFGVTPGCGPNVGTPFKPPSEGGGGFAVDPEVAVPELVPEAAPEPADAPEPPTTPEPLDVPEGVLDPDAPELV